MSLFRDLSAALRDGLTELLSADPKRDDVDELTHLLESDLEEARTELDQARRDYDRLSGRLAEELQQAERLKERAREAVDAGDDERGRELIRQRRRVLRGVEILEAQAAEHTQLCTALQDHMEALEDKLQEIQLRRDFLRTRHRVRSLQERYDRYQREFGLDELSGPAEDIADEAPAAADLDEDRAPAPEPPAGPPAPAERLATTEPAEPPALRRRDGRVELPPEEEAPGWRIQPAADEPSPWDRPARNLRRERDALLREIERRTASPEIDAEVEEELQRLKGRAGQATESPDAPPLVPPRPRPDDDVPPRPHPDDDAPPRPRPDEDDAGEPASAAIPPEADGPAPRG